jgi:hypothetical protein
LDHVVAYVSRDVPGHERSRDVADLDEQRVASLRSE